MIHLDAKTEYSFMRGYGSAEQWLARCKAIGASAFGIADYCSTWGHVPFQRAFSGSGVKLIYGVQLPVVYRLDKDPRHGLVTIIALNTDGLRQLYSTVTTAHEQTYYRPRIKWNQLKDLKHNCTVILNSGTLGDMDELQELDYGFVGAGLDLGLYRRAIEADEVPAIISVQPRYPTLEDRPGFEMVQAISGGHRIGEVDIEGVHMLREKEYGVNHAEQEAVELWIRNSKQVALYANAEIPRAKSISPPSKSNPTHQLNVLVKRGAGVRGLSLKSKRHKVYKERLEYELGIIADKAFEDYFLFVHELVSWAHDRMFVGPARGSSGGSLVCYCLGITQLDPIKFGTLFERFIDPGRTDWPDIDIDFPDNRRDEIFEHLREVYGADRVARLGTLSMFQGKSAINDTARAYSVAYTTGFEVNKFVESASTVTKTVKLQDLFSRDLPDLQAILKEAPELRNAVLLDGHVRHHGKHAAGVVVCQEPIVNYGSVDRDGVLAMDMNSAEAIGMIKMDALGLRTLSVIQDCCDQIEINPRSLYDLDFDNADVIEVFNNNNVTGIFQFEGVAVRSLMRQVTVENFDDLCAITSLARPGPLVGGAAANWVARRSGVLDWDFIHPALEEYTKETYGTIVYQEQAMKIVAGIGGFNNIEVNEFRRACGKKKIDVLHAMGEKFISHAAELFTKDLWGSEDFDIDDVEIHGRSTAEELWDEMCEFGAYAFNYSHAASYSMLSYMCAYLKMKAPLQFALACLRNSADEGQTKNLLRELTKEGYAYMPFCPDNSEVDWSIKGEILYGGFTAVRGIGFKTAQKIIEKRSDNPDWMNSLTDGMRSKLLAKYNTPWHDLNRMGQQYGGLYKNASNYKVKGPVYAITDIPEQKGNYCFIGKLIRRQLRDLNAPERLAKRDGQRYNTNDKFLNLYFEDDTGDIGCTINRWKYPSFEWLNSVDREGIDYLVRGDVINDDGRVWIFIENVKELKSGTNYT